MPLTRRSQKRLFLPPINVTYGAYASYTNYDILAVHVRYNRVEMDKFMKKGTKYISVIREPSAQWESAFAQFKFQEAFKAAAVPKIPEESWIATFLDRPQFYREILRDLWYENVVGRRWYYAQNSQIFDLGLNTDIQVDEEMINATIESLEKEFDLILLTEYFDESLLILKKQFCWDYTDILYSSKNIRTSRRTLTENEKHKIQKWNYADVLLYQHFNQTLWSKIGKYGSEFSKDLDHFRELNHIINKQCGENINIDKNVPVTFSAKKNTSLLCKTIGEDKTKLFRRVFNRQDPYFIYNVYDRRKGT